MFRKQKHIGLYKDNQMHGKGKMWFNNGSTADGIWEKGALVEANLKIVSDGGSVEEMKGTFK